MDEETCACGHVWDEHDDQGECQVDDCPCILFDIWKPEEDTR